MPVEEVLTSVQIQVLKAKSLKLPETLTVSWAIELDRLIRCLVNALI